MAARDTFRMTGVAAALVATLGPAHAAEPMASYGQLNTAGNTGSIGLGFADSDGRRFGQYNGINENGAYGLLDFSLSKRDETTGTWLGFFGRNVGLDNRQLRFEHSRQGNWGYSVEFTQTPRYEPLAITTGVTGIGSTSLGIPAPGTTGSPFDLKTRRDALNLGFDKVISGNWDLQFSFRNEKKEGARLFARGDTGGVLPSFCDCDFAPEPIDATTRQFEAKANYSGSQLQLSGGYYGTMYRNELARMDLTGGSSTITPLGLPPDNQSHQFSLAGNYGFTPTTHGTFKVAYAKATQEDSFITGVPIAAGIGPNLQGRVDTTLAQGGVTSRPMPKLTLLADFRYEDRNDKTPVLLYLTPAGTTTDGSNEPRSIRTTTGKAEASYMLPHSFKLTGGLGYEEKHRNTSAVRIVSFRDTTEEKSYRVELRRLMAETVTGAVSYIHSDRDGSPWLQTTVVGGGTGSNLIAPIHLADRKRDKVRLSIDWTPVDPLNINFFLDEARDDYSTRDGSTIGPMKGKGRNYSVDAGYTFNQMWQGNVWYTWNDTKADQTTCVGASSSGVCGAQTYSATLRNVSDSFGLGLRGKPTSTLEIGADISYSDISDEYQQQALTGAAITAIPNISTKLTRINLFGKYKLQKNSGVRLDYIYDRYTTDDWTWSTFMYSDGTRARDPNQKVNFIGVSYFYRFQ